MAQITAPSSLGRLMFKLTNRNANCLSRSDDDVFGLSMTDQSSAVIKLCKYWIVWLL